MSPSVIQAPTSEPEPICIRPAQNNTTKTVASGAETTVAIEVTSDLYTAIRFSLGMKVMPVDLNNLLAERFSALATVRAVLAGQSDEILHVWVMIDEWTPEARKAVYTVQKSIMKDLRGLSFDFYVVDIPSGSQPNELVSDMPIIFHRA